MRQAPIGTSIAAAIALVALASSAPSSAQSASPFPKLAGYWSGSGTARLDGGQTEKLTCRGSYTLKDGGAGLGLALRCASTAASFDLRSQLTYRAGRVSGTWEERSFNASGGVSGQASGSSMNMVIDGGGLAGSMSVSFGEAAQSVSINATGAGFQGVYIKLKRS